MINPENVVKSIELTGEQKLVKLIKDHDPLLKNLEALSVENLLEIIQKNPKLRDQVILEEVYEGEDKRSMLDRDLTVLPKFINLQQAVLTI